MPRHRDTEVAELADLVRARLGPPGVGEIAGRILTAGTAGLTYRTRRGPMKFWDSSALIPLCFDELQTAPLRKLAEDDEAIVAWRATPVVCYSAFARLRREELLTTTEEEQAWAVLTVLAAEWTEIEPSRVVREQAGRALLLHPLRAAEALQLAAALVWSRGRTAGHYFVCLDQRLREVARREGFALLPKEGRYLYRSSSLRTIPAIATMAGHPPAEPLPWPTLCPLTQLPAT